MPISPQPAAVAVDSHPTCRVERLAYPLQGYPKLLLIDKAHERGPVFMLAVLGILPNRPSLLRLIRVRTCIELQIDPSV